MPERLIVPNLHVTLVHFPIALLLVGLLIEVFSVFWRRGSFRIAGRWMIALGAMSALPVAASGLYALNDIARTGVGNEGAWSVVKSTSPLYLQHDVWRLLWQHMFYASIGSGLCALAVAIWIGSSDRGRRSLHWPLLLVLLAGTSIILSAAMNAGEAVYRHGASTVSNGFPAKNDIDEEDPHPRWEAVLPPMQVHVLMAGVVASLALTATALAWRKVNATVELEADRRPIIPSENTMAEPSRPTAPDSMTMIRTFNPDIEVVVQPFAPAGRFWLLTSLVALLTICGGIYCFGDFGSSHTLLARAKDNHLPIAKQFWNEIKLVDKQHQNEPITRDTARRFAHLASAGVILLLPLALGMCSRWAPRKRAPLAAFSLVMLATIGCQVFFGILLLYDGATGPLTRFSPAEPTKPAAVNR